MVKAGKRKKDTKRKASHQANILNFIVMITFKHENRKFSSVPSEVSGQRMKGKRGESGKLNCYANNQLLILSSCEKNFGELNEYFGTRIQPIDSGIFTSGCF